MAIIKDDTIDQIPLFELPKPQKAGEEPVPTAGQSGKAATSKQPPRKAAKPGQKPGKGPRKPARTAKVQDARVGPVPEGDVRLTANIRQELHLRLKIVAATRRTTIGELIEELVEQYL